MTERIGFRRNETFVVAVVDPLAVGIEHTRATGLIDEPARVIALPRACLDYTPGVCRIDIRPRPGPYPATA